MTARHSRTVEGAAPIDPSVTHPKLVPWLRIVGPLVTLMVLVQAVFAGRGLFLDNDLLKLHGNLGSLTLLLVVIQAGLVLFAGFRGRLRATLIGTNLLLLLLVIVQLMLGYSARDGSTQAAAWHIPNGVLIFGLTVGCTSFFLSWRPSADAG